MEDNRIDVIELELNQLSEAQTKADHALAKAQAAQAEAEANAKQISATVDRLMRQRKELGERRKRAIGLAFFECLEAAGLREALVPHVNDVTKIPATVRRALAQVSQRPPATLGELMVIAIAKAAAKGGKSHR